MKKLIEQYNAYVERLKYFGDSIYQKEATKILLDLIRNFDLDNYYLIDVKRNIGLFDEEKINTLDAFCTSYIDIIEKEGDNALQKNSLPFIYDYTTALTKMVKYNKYAEKFNVHNNLIAGSFALKICYFLPTICTLNFSEEFERDILNLFSFRHIYNKNNHIDKRLQTFLKYMIKRKEKLVLLDPEFYKDVVPPVLLSDIAYVRF
jgi:hypothetical protein